MYVVKVGEFYIKDVDIAFGGFISDIILSKEIMKNFTKEVAKNMAKLVNGKVVEMTNEVTND